VDFSAKNGVSHKFGIDVKHKRHYIFGIKASQLYESKHKTFMHSSYMNVLWSYSLPRNGDCWVSLLSRPNGSSINNPIDVSHTEMQRHMFFLDCCT